MKKYNLNTAITSALRKVWLKYPPRKEAIELARDPANRKYVICALCKTSTHEKIAHVDHLVPIAGLLGPISIDEKISRMFVPAFGYQILCEDCHKVKTDNEKHARKILRESLKPKKEPKRAKKKT